MRRIPAIGYKQNEQQYFTTVMPFSLLQAVSHVLIYDNTTGEGYQRKPNKLHVSRIKNYILNHPSDFKLPTSITLGIDEYDLVKLLSKDNCGEYLNLSEQKHSNLFRIVDGQHRIEGLREAYAKDPQIGEYMVPVVIIVKNDTNKFVEVEVFTDINSKAKRISTDLAVLARYNYQLKEGETLDNYPETIKHIAIKAAFSLKENSESVWSAGIKFDIHADVVLGAVGVTLFAESIEDIVKAYYDKYPDTERRQLLDYYKYLSEKIATDLNEIWTNIIAVKWSDCFKKHVLENEMGELKTAYYLSEYYIQKTLGVKVLNVLFGQILRSVGPENAIDKFEQLIQTSRVTSTDWSRGGPFAGLSSESGFSKVRDMVGNKIDTPRRN